MTEIINIRVRVEIEYNDPKYRKEAIEKAKENVTGIKTYGSISIRPLTAKLLK